MTLLKVIFHCHKPFFFHFFYFHPLTFSVSSPVMPGVKPNVPQERWKPIHLLPLKRILCVQLCTTQFCIHAPKHTVLTYIVIWEYMTPFWDSLYTPEQLSWILGDCKLCMFFTFIPYTIESQRLRISSSLMFTGRLISSFLLCSPWCPPGTGTSLFYSNFYMSFVTLASHSLIFLACCKLYSLSYEND